MEKRGAWVAWWVKHLTLDPVDLRVVRLNPESGSVLNAESA